MAKNYYVILGVASDATQDEIRSAYRRRAQALHPDHHDEGRQPFLEVQEAYSVLGDPSRRSDYDRSRMPGAVPVQRGGGWSSGSGDGPITPVEEFGLPPNATRPADLGDVSVMRSFETHRPSIDALFDRLWDNFRDVTRRKSEQAEGLHIEVPITREQALRGGRARVLVPAQATCPTCRGSGGVGPLQCMRCAGEGAIGGDYPVRVDFPGGIARDRAVSIPLDRYGIHNLYLTVHFRVTDVI